LERFGEPFFQAASFRFLLFLLSLLVGAIAAFHGVDAAIFLIEIAKHTAHGFLARAADGGHFARFDEFGNPLLDCSIFLRRALGDFAEEKLIHDVPFAAASFHA